MSEDPTGSGLGGSTGSGVAGGSTAGAVAGGTGGLPGVAVDGGASALVRMTRGTLPEHGHVSPSTGGEIDYLRSAWGTDHLAADDPHAGYLLESEADATYATDADLAAHAAAPDPHPIYLTDAEGDAEYADIDHTHMWYTAAREFYFSANTNTSVDPGQGNLRADSGNLTTATHLSMDVLTNDGLDLTAIVRTLQQGDVFLVQDKDVGANWVRYQLTAAPTAMTGYWKLDVIAVASSGALNVPQLVGVVFFVQSGVAGSGGSLLTGDPLWDAKGDLVAATGADAATRLPAGTDGQFLNADSAQTTGLGWVANPVTAHAALPNAHHAQAHDHTAADGSGTLTNDAHDGYSQYANLGADPTQPGTNTIRLYSKDNGSGVATLYYRTEDGTIYELPTLTGGGNGSGAPSNATYITTGSEAKLSAERVLGTAVIMSGLLSARPAFGTAGRLYLATDTDLVYRDTGSAWETFATRAVGGAGAYVDEAGDTMTGALVLQGASGTDTVLQAKLAADTQPRFRADANGKLEWGPGGSTVPNSALARTGSGILGVTGDLLPATTDASNLGTTSFIWTQVAGRRLVTLSDSASSYVQVGLTSPAGAGAVRLKNAATVGWRNATNNGDLTLSMNASDQLALAVGAASLTTTATAGAAGAPPAQVTGYLTVVLNGTARKLPYYSV